MLILPITEYLNELLQYSSLAAITSLSELCRIMIVAIDVSIMLIVTVLSPENGRA